MNTRQKGSRGEERAVEYLLDRGYTVVTRNYEAKNGEIDCIAKDPEDTLVFIEVKASRGNSMGSPFFRVNRAKQQQIRKMAQRYLAEHRIQRQPCRFDVIAIQGEKIEHMKNAFI